MNQTPYDDRLWAYHQSWTAPEAQDMSTNCPELLPYKTAHFYVPHQYHQFRPSDPLPTTHYNGSDPSAFGHHSYLLVPARSASWDGCGASGFPQPSDTNPSSSSHPSSDLLLGSPYGSSPHSLHYSTLGPALYSNFTHQQSSWSTGDAHARSVAEHLTTPNEHHSPTPQLQIPDATFYPYSDYTLEPYGGTLGVSYPCLWTEGGRICNIMVPATRSHMNRHLHAHHGFGGSDARQTRCHWAGCGETMQQGSIARHMVACHLRAKVTCPFCSKKLSRQDVISKHQRVCPAAGAWP